MKVITTLLLAVSLSAFGQTAKVIVLSPEDAATAHSLEQQKKDLEKKTQDFEDHITLKYLVVDPPKEVKQGSLTNKELLTDNNGFFYYTGPKFHGKELKPGWGNGFEYTEDFKFIVPKPVSQQINSPGCLNSGTPCIYPGINSYVVPATYTTLTGTN